MPSQSFQRARRPAQKEQRRQAILDAAAALLAEGGLEAVSLNAIGRQVGLAKSNVYRYFESREEILCQLLIDDETRWVGALERALAPLAGSDDVAAVSDRIVATVLEHPRLCLLTSVVANVLEQNISRDTVTRFKERTAELSIRIRNALHAALPSLPHEVTPALLRYLHAGVAGLWPMAHPSPVVSELLARPELADFRTHFETDLRGMLVAMLNGSIGRP